MYNIFPLGMGKLHQYYLAENMRWHRAKIRKLDKISKMSRRRNRK